MKYSESLKRNRDYQLVYRKGKSVANKYLILYVMENNLDINRVGISVSKKVGNSVVRHRITRLIRESYRLSESDFNRGLDFVILARPDAKGKSFKEIESALKHVGRIQKVIK